MDEKYLFRGKSKYTGEWVMGGHCKTPQNSFILVGKRGHYLPDMIEVYPKTVGLRTGLTDKRGKFIFAGDILKMYFELYGYNAVVEWDKRGYWVYKIPYYGKKSKYPLIRKFDYFDKSGNCFNVEIIGNIHDNQELLRTKEAA